jgi:hypothetical protein
VSIRLNVSEKNSKRPFRISNVQNSSFGHGIASVLSDSSELVGDDTVVFASSFYIIPVPTVKPEATPEEIREVVENPEAGGQIFSNAV